MLAGSGLAGQNTSQQTVFVEPSASLTEAKVFAFESLPVTHTAVGGEGRVVTAGRLKTGERVAMHESMLPVGAPPNPAHRIEHSEFIHIREGIVEFLHDGRAERAGPGSVIFVAYGTMHALKNVGDVPARYLVTQIGGDTKV
jgi:quercetin dioxygenase-like cupin family protein